MIDLHTAMLKDPRIEKALLLRKKGHTFTEIMGELHVSKSTLSGWINRYISEQEEQGYKQLTAIKGKLKISKINKQRSTALIKSEGDLQDAYANQVEKIDKNALFWLGVGLYMAEGAKTGRWKSIFYNSDPVLNKLMIDFYRTICNAPEERIHVQLILHENISEESAVDYWSNILTIPKAQFNKASFVKSKASKGKRPKDSLPYGTAQIVIGNKKIAHMMKGWMLGIKRQVEQMNEGCYTDPT